MGNLALLVDKRDENEIGKNASRRLRSGDFIPAVMYGLGGDPVNIKVDEKKFKEMLKDRSILSLIFDIHINGAGKNKKETAILKDVQRNPITREFQHLDFLRIEMEKEVETSVPILIVNEEESLGVKEDGGVLQHGLRELHVSCLPVDIPEKIKFDIKDLRMGDIVRVSEIEVEDKVKILNDPNEVVVSIIHPTHLVVEEEVEEVEEEAVEEEPEIIGKGKEEDREKPKEEELKKEEPPKAQQQQQPQQHPSQKRK